MMKLENHDGHMRSVSDSFLTQLTLTGMLEEQPTQGVAGARHVRKEGSCVYFLRASGTADCMRMV